MRRAEPMSDAEYREHVLASGLMMAWGFRDTGGDDSPFEPKANAWGWLNGRPVAVDYSNI